ncbi:hypothetical protein AB0N17_35720 [Streptomyces sp. NPDC051133]|uniref:hypothetical protein n=1 Tax=Streptomyces sp. NPDC051133 TaxID=3155521 RepID=UPI00341B87EB
MDGDASYARQRHVIDWLEQASDLPHLIARVSELVLRLGYEPEDLVVMPRAELDRRELAAYSAGWADVVEEQLPAVRQAYEQRITAAYLQGQEDARTGRRPRRARRPEAEREHDGGEVIQLPYVQLLRPPSELTRVEQRGHRERSVADGGPVPAPGPVPAFVAGGAGGGTAHPSAPASASASYDGPVGDTADATDGDAGPHDDSGQPDTGTAPDSSGDALFSAREVREKRTGPVERRPVVRRNGRPSVPPLARPADPGAGRDKGRRAGTGEASDTATAPSGERTRLSDRARALADEFEGRGTGRRKDEPPGPADSR